MWDWTALIDSSFKEETIQMLEIDEWINKMCLSIEQDYYYYCCDYYCSPTTKWYLTVLVCEYLKTSNTEYIFISLLDIFIFGKI